MIDSRETDELIERYCFNELTPEELKVFEQWLVNDEELKSEVVKHKMVLSGIDIVARRIDLKKKLNDIHDAMATEAFSYKSPLKVVKKETSVIKKFYQRYKVISIAAAVTIVAVTGTLVTGALTGLFSTRQQSAYQALRLEVEKLKRSQRALIKGINVAKESAEEPVIESGFIGSGLALTSNGYLLTSYHVVKDATGIFVSNNRYEQLKAEVVFTNEQLDVSILKINDENFKSFGDIPYSLKRSVSDQGEKVFTLGYPKEDVVYNEGSVSSVSGFEGDTTSYQVAIPVNPGNSGGPLFDNQANLIGIISGRNNGAEGASFAIQSKCILDYIKEHAHSDLTLPTNKNLKGIDRPSQVRKLKDFVFMVKVFN